MVVAKLEQAVTELIDLVKHLVSTHVHWNVDLSKDEAMVKIEAARLALLASDVEELVADVADGNLDKVVTDGEKLVADVKTLTKSGAKNA
jgi:hypothetical protein